VHHHRLVKGAFQIFGKESATSLRGVHLPDLDELLRAEAPLRIHGGQGRIFAYRLDSGDTSWVSQQVTGQPFWYRDGLSLIALIRGESVVPPGNVTRFEAGDNLILAATEQAYEEFRRTRQQTGGSESQEA
jgi:NhaP-type Na+/H+ and K+/H+ antiporter